MNVSKGTQFPEQNIEIKDSLCIIKDNSGKPSCTMTLDQACKIGIIDK